MFYRWLRYIARTISLLWAMLWVFFGAASGFGEGESPGGILIHTAMPGLLFLISTLAAWKWEFTGGILLMLEGLSVMFVYPMMARTFPTSTIIFVLLTMALPPLISGLLLLFSSRSTRRVESPTQE